MHSDDAWGRFGKRLAARVTNDVWIGIVVRVVANATVETASGFVHTPGHFIGAAWPPLEKGLSRLPEVVVIGSPRSDNALIQLFDHLPGEAKLYLAGPDEVDAALAAEILLAADRNLEPYQRTAIAQFVAVERERTRACIRAIYTDRDAQFERFRDAVTRVRSD